MLKTISLPLSFGSAVLAAIFLSSSAFAQTAPRADKAAPKAAPKVVKPAAAAVAAPAQPAAKADRIMTIDELRACMQLNAANEAQAKDIVLQQQAFKNDESAVRAEQAEVNTANAAARKRAAAIVAERDALNAMIPVMNERAAAAKTDAEKAAYEADRATLVERGRVLQQETEAFNASQQPLRERVDALNVQIAVINQRALTVNELVEPQQKQVEVWREQCGNRRFREDDEVIIKKELAAGK
ncbi:MAG: hypothetical protein EAZ43_12370 [Betaproteobacteria bacterium]|nr:MAG: hypothetical protein EAZ43_12370 [Betaproteobacteria bacterium]